MDSLRLSFREVIPDQTLPEKWKDFTLNTGGTQSTLQDIKVPQRAGGYSYKDPTKPYTRNRFIYWRLYDDVLELVEHSLDINLVGNQVRYHFQDSPVLEGLSIHETSKSVVVLVCTVSSVHRLTFPLPDRVHRQDYILNHHPESTAQSVFAEASLAAARDPASFHVINSSAANTLMPHSSASWLSPNQEALFALAYTNGTMLLARHDARNGTVATLELKQESLTSRFLFGFAGALRGRQSEENVVASMMLHSFGSDTFLFCLGRSGQLRIWSCSRGQCVMVSDVIDDAADYGKNMTQGAQSHVLRKAVGDGENDNELLLGVFLCFSTECQFAVIQITYISGNFRPNRLFTIHAPNGQDLVDFSLCHTQLWAVWRNTQGETAVSTVNINSSFSDTLGSNGDAQWRPAVLEPGPERDFVIADAMTEPRQAYVSYIFHPGRFSLPVIIKALSIFRRSPGVTLINDVATSAGILKEHVCQAVESEIQNEVSDYELIDEDYLEVANRCWAKFYSCCVQYHISGSRPIGLLLLVPSGGQSNAMVSTSGVALVNKSYVSLLRPMDYLETLFCEDLSNLSHLVSLNVDPNVEYDLSNLIQAINLVEQHLSDETKTGFEQELYRLQSPEIVMEKLVSGLAQHDSMDEEFDTNLKNDLECLLKNVVEIPKSIAVLLNELDISRSGVQANFQTSSSDMARHLYLINQLFSSQMGISTIAEATRQFSVMRFSLCRNLLLLQHILLDLSEDLCSSQVAHSLRTELIPRTATLTQAYFIMIWICQTPATPVVKPNIVESSMQRMAILKLSDATGTAAATASALGSARAQQRSYSLLELFLQTTATRQVQRLLASSNISPDLLPHWSGSMLPFVAVLSQLIWPITNNFIFPEFLLSSCQHLLLQEYVRLLNKWCESNICSRKFLLGSALLDMGEPHKALDLFVEASEGLTSEEFLASKIVPVAEECTKDRVRIVYFLKVIQLFEQQNCPDCVIQLAETASEIAEKDDPDLATLHSVAFVNHLRLEHHQEAYHSLNSNPDSARRVDCLRQLVVTLLELKRLDLLLEFPYESLVFDLERIVESRARSLDVSNSIFYNFLYAFHIKKGNFRKAASIMYEQGMRLGLEGTHSAELTERQAKCFLACLNALQVVDPKFAWIVKPSLAIVNNEDEDENSLSSMSPKRNSEGEQVKYQKWKREVEVLEIADIRKEYEVVQCRLRLIRHSPEKYKRTGCRLASSELVAVLSQVGMYQAAVKLCRTHKLSFQPVLESLTSACVRLTNAESSNKDPNALWEWLSENDLSELGVGEGNPVTLAWRLLEVMVMSCEEDKQTVLHKAVACRLLALGVFLPNWLVTSYKERNPSEFLRLLLGSGRLSEAGFLAVEYIQAALGHGKDRFGLQSALHVTSPSVCLPISTFKLLLMELEEAAIDDMECKELFSDLSQAVCKYMDTTRNISEGMEKAAQMSR